jgi:galactokinase
MSLQQRVSEVFCQRFAAPPNLVIRAPGRVNLIGEHTDYNDGFVLPMAIDRAMWIALRPRPDRQVIVHSIDYAHQIGFHLDAIEKGPAGWGEYLKGVAWAMQEAGHRLKGWEGVLVGNVPIGAGLSSSAALEMATARAFAAASGLDWDPIRMAQIGQRAENQWVGVNCGIMDQLVSAAGRPNHALLIDCRSLEIQPVPLPPDTTVVVMDTATRRGLVDSAYNERRSQCEAAAHFFGVAALRDVSLAQFADRADEMEEVIRRRARHVITENERTRQAAKAMHRGDALRFGQLMRESHVSLRDDFEVSNPELNAMVSYAQQQPACHGARMTGGGFGGCAVALVRAGEAERFAEAVGACYHAATRISQDHGRTGSRSVASMDTSKIARISNIPTVQAIEVVIFPSL